MNKTLELISLDDSELLDVVGGCRPPCRPCPPPPPSCGCGSGVEVAIGIVIAL